MPRIPQDTKSNSAQFLTGEGQKSGQDRVEDVIQFELARLAKYQKDRLASFQLEDRLEGITHELSSEIDKIYGETLPFAGDGLTRKALEAIDKRLETESAEFTRAEKEHFKEAFEPFRPKLLQKAAELESEARETYYLGRLRDEAERLSAKVLETGALAPDELDGLKAKIEKADLTEHQKKDFSKQVQKEMRLTEIKARLIKDETFRESHLNGGDNLNLEKVARSELVRFAKVHHLQTLNDEARASYHDFKELDGMIARDEIGFTEATPRISHLPQHLQDRLRAREQQRDEAFNLARSFQANPKDKKTAVTLLQHLTSGKDILADDETRAFVAGFTARHQIIPANIANTLRQAAETRDPARLIRAVELAEDIEGVSPDVFKDHMFSALRRKVKLIQLLRERVADEKTRETALLDILQPEKPLGPEELERLHGGWIEKQAGLFASGEEARSEFVDQLRNGLEITNGERELALQIAEVMHSKEGKRDPHKPTHDQKVNRAEREDRLDKTDYPEKERQNLEKLTRKTNSPGDTPAGKIGHSARWTPDDKLLGQTRKKFSVANRNRPPLIGAIESYPIKLLNAKHKLELVSDFNRKLLWPIIQHESRFLTWAHAKHPNPKKLATARGLGQFIRDTWAAVVKEHNRPLYNYVSAQFDGNTRSLAFKKRLHILAFHPQLNYQMLIAHHEKNAFNLKQVNIPITTLNLYMMHFLGEKDGIKMIRAAKTDKSLAEVLGAKKAADVSSSNPNVKRTPSARKLYEEYRKLMEKAETYIHKNKVDIPKTLY